MDILLGKKGQSSIECSFIISWNVLYARMASFSEIMKINSVIVEMFSTILMFSHASFRVKNDNTPGVKRNSFDRLSVNDTRSLSMCAGSDVSVI